MGDVQIGRKNYEMPPRKGISIAHFLTIADIKAIDSMLRKGLGRSHSELGGDGDAEIADMRLYRMILPKTLKALTPDKYDKLTLSIRPRPEIASENGCNYRDADVKTCYKLWKSPGVGISCAGRWASAAEALYIASLADVYRESV